MPPIKIHFMYPDEGEHDDGVPLTDVGVVDIDGERHLFLVPQSFYSAVRQVSLAMPDLPLELVERLVRENCEFRDFDEMLEATAERAPVVDLPPLPKGPPTPVRPSGRAKKWVVAAALLPAFAGAWALGHLTGTAGASSAASAPDEGPSAAPDPVSDNRNLGPEPFTAREFEDFSSAGKISCSPIDDLEAECTDADGMVMATKAATGPDSTIFTFSYGRERIGLRIFGTAGYAQTWAQQDGSRELYPNMIVSGRYVLWGTDEDRLKVYQKLLEETKNSTAKAQFHTLGAAEPLPPRLAALTLGTLGLDKTEVHTILLASEDVPVDDSVLLAAQAVLGLGSPSDAAVKPGEEDIVALAMGLEQPSTAGTPNPGPTMGNVVQVTGSTEPPWTGAGDSSADAEATSSPDPRPEPDPRPAPEPSVSEQVQTPEEPAKQPTAPEPTPAPDPKDEEPTTTAVTPAPVDPSPTESAPSSNEKPAPEPAQTQAPTGSAAEEPSAATEPTPADEDQDDEDTELVALPQAWVAPAA